MSEFSQDFKRNIVSVSSPDAVLHLIVITHKELAEPLRLCCNTEDLVINGQKYYATAFELTEPELTQGTRPRAQVKLSNIGRELTQFAEYVDGKDAILETFKWSASEHEVLYPTGAWLLSGLDIDRLWVMITLTVDGQNPRRAVKKQFTPQNSKGMF